MSILDDLEKRDGYTFVRFGNLFERRKEKERPDLQPLSVFLDDGVVPRSSRDDNHNSLGSNLSNYLVVQPGDIVFNKLRTWQGGLGISNFNGIVSPAYYVCRPTDKVAPKYIHYLLRSDIYKAELTRISKWMPPSQFDINWNDLRNLPILLPSLSKQRNISVFLDRKTSQFDDLIARKQRLIELLHEQRTALINRAVTKGLNPDAPMKDSGIEWLGEVPAHWTIGQLRYASESIQTGPFGSQLHSEEYIDDGIPVINPSNIGNGKIKANWSITVDESVFQRLTRHRLDVGDIVFGRRGEMGRCALVTEKEDGWLCGTGCLRLRLNTEKVFPPFIAIYLSTIRIKEWLELQSVGSTMSNLNTEILSRIPIPLLSVDEQQKIVEAINTSESQISTIIDKETKLIELLRSFRTSLISEVVTGKIDVRDEVPA